MQTHLDKMAEAFPEHVSDSQNDDDDDDDGLDNQAKPISVLSLGHGNGSSTLTVCQLSTNLSSTT